MQDNQGLLEKGVVAMRRNSNRTSNRTGRAVEDGLMLFAGIGAGLAAMYLLDPHAGQARRRRLGDLASSAWDQAHAKTSQISQNLAEQMGERVDQLRQRGATAASQLAENVRDAIPGYKPEHHYIGQS